jgi:hypothetical protein
VNGHTGGVLDGRPIFCVQAASADCFAYNKATKHWDQGSILQNFTDTFSSSKLLTEFLSIMGSGTDFENLHFGRKNFG